jgi:hypothetical protein
MAERATNTTCKSTNMQHVLQVHLLPAYLGTKVGSAADGAGVGGASGAADAAGLPFFKRMLRALTGSGGAGLDTTLLLVLLLLLLLLLLHLPAAL